MSQQRESIGLKYIFNITLTAYISDNSDAMKR